MCQRAGLEAIVNNISGGLALKYIAKRKAMRRKTCFIFLICSKSSGKRNLEWEKVPAEETVLQMATLKHAGVNKSRAFPSQATRAWLHRISITLEDIKYSVC